MGLALVATVVLVPTTPKPAQPSSIREPLQALRHGPLARISVVGLLYNWGFFTLLGYSPFLMHLSALQLGAVFCGWGIFVAVFAVFAAPVLKARFGTAATLYVSLILVAVVPGNRWVVIAAVIASGALIGLNNTLVTTAVMSISPVPRSVASASYGFVRFIGGGLAPYVAGKLVEHYNAHVPFALGALVVLAGAALLTTVHRALAAADHDNAHPGRPSADGESPDPAIPVLSDGVADVALADDGDSPDAGRFKLPARPADVGV